MNSWPVVNARLNRFLGSAPEAEGKHLRSEPLRIDSWNWAQRVFVTHTPMQKRATLVVESPGYEVVLPDDLIRVVGVYDSSEERWWWPVHRWKAGDYRPSDDSSLTYWSWGGRLYLEYELSTTQTEVEMYYHAFYPDVEYELDDAGSVTLTQPRIYTPNWAEPALFHLTTAFVLQPLEVESSNLSQYKIRVESGHPEHNPRAQSALFHLNWYQILTGMVRSTAGDDTVGPTG